MSNDQIKALYYAAFVAANNSQSQFAITLFKMAEQAFKEAGYDGANGDYNRASCLKYHKHLFS